MKSPRYQSLEWEKGQYPVWVPIEDGYPLPDELVLITLRGGYLTLGYFTEVEDFNGIKSYSFYTYDDYYGGDTTYEYPIAWCYLPKPFKE